MFKSASVGLCLAALIVMSPGCSKKTTKVTPEPQPPKPPIESVKPQGDEVSFIGQDMDSRAAELLVPLHFAYNRADLSAEAIARLERIGPFLVENPAMTVLVEGNCDERGSAEYNMGLGENRARAVKNWLSAYGVASSRIEVTSYGKERPLNPFCQDEECHAVNRRAEWKVLSR